MNRQQFLSSAVVQEFVDYLRGRLPTLQIQLDIKRSRFVLNPVQQKICGLQNVIQSYVWRSQGMDAGSWDETKIKISNLRNNLKTALASNEQEKVLSACREILQWGGNRNYKTGAYCFLQKKSQAGELISYLDVVKNALSLEHGNIAQLDVIEKMNAMLTKIHAFATEDGLPIYDSRVASAIGTLVEMWRRENGRVNIDDELIFPPTTRARSVQRCFPDATCNLTTLNYSPESARVWASAKVRLGWLMQAVIENQPELFEATLLLPEKLHQFEASLFMLGYDASCIGDGGINDNCELTLGGNRQVIKRVGVQRQSEYQTTCETLSGQGKPIKYSRLSGVYHVLWGKTFAVFDEDLVDALFIEFAETEVKLGADMSNSPEGSIGYWLKSEYNLSPRFASVLMAILKSEGQVTAAWHGRSIMIKFQ